MWDLPRLGIESPLNPPILRIGSQILNHRITREVPFDILAKDQKAPQCTLMCVCIYICVLFLNFFPYTWNDYSLFCMYSWILTAGYQHARTHIRSFAQTFHTPAHTQTQSSQHFPANSVYTSITLHNEGSLCSIFASKWRFNRKIQIK